MNTTAGAVTAIVVHWNAPERCAETVRALQQEHGVERVIVVDNGGGPVNLDANAGVEDVEVIETGANLGFGGGANAGLRRWLAGNDGEWALVLPHDAQPAPHCVQRLLDAARQRPHAGLASAEYGDDEVPVIDPFFGGMTVPAVRGDGWEPAGYAHGTFLLVRRACLDDIGLFDERYFAYCEEADLAIRARRAGWEVGIVWGAVVANPDQRSARPVVDYLMVRNTIVLVRIHFGRYRATVRFVLEAIATLRMRVQPSRRTPWYSWRARVAALRDAARGIDGPPPARLR